MPAVVLVLVAGLPWQLRARTTRGRDERRPMSRSNDDDDDDALLRPHSPDLAVD